MAKKMPEAMDYTPVTYDPQYILMVNHLKKYFPIKGGLLSQTVVLVIVVVFASADCV